MPLFFGFVGVFNVVLLWPIIPLLSWLGIEPFQLPFNSTLWLVLLVNAFVGTFLSDYLWLLAMLMTSPLVVTLGISLTIPLALVGDVVIKHTVPDLQYICGTILVLIGFFAVNVAALSDVQDKAIYDEHELVPQDEIFEDDQHENSTRCSDSNRNDGNPSNNQQHAISDD
ncbi:hypothetical protein DFQ28_003074 [Apophysomyces sp. BC1034]|nr:hypothetical protein DFQ29_002282 [Apophysomyces sp. BC1021]KAG0189712.1 hypothetical protein DFQ28_003074 [Apophysomyces sp. BC1034]